MEYNEIENKELKTVLCLLEILQATRALPPDEENLLKDLTASFPVVPKGKRTIYSYAKEHKMIDAPEFYRNNQGAKIFVPIDNSSISKDVVLTEKGKEELEKLLPFARKWQQDKKTSERIDDLQSQFLELQIQYTQFARETTQETIKIAKSARCAAWASAICALISVLLAIMGLFKTLVIN